MYVSIPPRFGVSAAAGAATVATQKTAPRPAAANPDVLIISSLPPSGCWDGSVAPSSTAFSGEACWDSASKRRSSTQVSAPPQPHHEAGLVVHLQCQYCCHYQMNDDS